MLRANPIPALHPTNLGIINVLDGHEVECGRCSVCRALRLVCRTQGTLQLVLALARLFVIFGGVPELLIEAEK